MTITKDNFIKTLADNTDEVLKGFKTLAMFVYNLDKRASGDVSGRNQLAAMKASDQQCIMQFRGERLIETLKTENVEYKRWLEIYQEDGIDNYLKCNFGDTEDISGFAKELFSEINTLYYNYNDIIDGLRDFNEIFWEDSNGNDIVEPYLNWLYYKLEDQTSNFKKSSAKSVNSRNIHSNNSLFINENISNPQKNNMPFSYASTTANDPNRLSTDVDVSKNRENDSTKEKFNRFQSLFVEPVLKELAAMDSAQSLDDDESLLLAKIQDGISFAAPYKGDDKELMRQYLAMGDGAVQSVNNFKNRNPRTNDYWKRIKQAAKKYNTNGSSPKIPLKKRQTTITGKPVHHPKPINSNGKTHPIVQSLKAIKSAFLSSSAYQSHYYSIEGILTLIQTSPDKKTDELIKSKINDGDTSSCFNNNALLGELKNSQYSSAIVHIEKVNKFLNKKDEKKTKNINGVSLVNGSTSNNALLSTNTFGINNDQNDYIDAVPSAPLPDNDINKNIPPAYNPHVKGINNVNNRSQNEHVENLEHDRNVQAKNAYSELFHSKWFVGSLISSLVAIGGGGILFAVEYASSDQFFTKVDHLHGSSLWQCIGFSIAILGIAIGLITVFGGYKFLQSRDQNNPNNVSFIVDESDIEPRVPFAEGPEGSQHEQTHYQWG